MDKINFVAFLLRILREKKARELLEFADNVKLYLDGSKNIIADGIKVYEINGSKPVLGRDKGGNYVVLPAGNNNLSVGFVALKDFAAAAAAPTMAPVILPLKEKKFDLSCFVKSGTAYILGFNKETMTFAVSVWE